jgi:hypothetical protein
VKAGMNDHHGQDQIYLKLKTIKLARTHKIWFLILVQTSRRSDMALPKGSNTKIRREFAGITSEARKGNPQAALKSGVASSRAHKVHRAPRGD